jgi:magnesium-protoporphyrin O-methyltransferase
MPDGRPGCDPGCGCRGNEFGEATAKRDLRAYRKNGPGTTTRWLIEGLEAGGVEGLTVLDIGAGVGAVHQRLLADGAASAIDVDGSAAFVAAARTEATVRGTIERIRYEVGDFVDLAPEIEDSDLVALDRVICCYPDMVSLVRLSVAHARRRYGLVYPRDTWWIRLGARVINAVSRLFRQPTTAYVHRTAEVDAIVRDAGFVSRLSRSGMFWQVAVYERTAPG